jgi:TrmH family RNA methyltransferase
VAIRSDSSDEVIRSHDNRTLKLIRSLRSRKTRESERAFVVEGVRAIEDGLRAGGVARTILLREDASWTPPPGVNVPIKRVAAALFDDLAETVTPQPLLAIFDLPDLAFPKLEDPLILIADGVRDPGNLGTLIRSAAGAGAAAVLLTAGTVDPYNGKAARAGMGAHFRVPIATLDEQVREWLSTHCERFVLASSDAEDLYSEFDLAGAVAIIVGSEADGPTEAGVALATSQVRIQLANEVESLNASVAGSILLFEAARQRAARQN